MKLLRRLARNWVLVCSLGLCLLAGVLAVWTDLTAMDLYFTTRPGRWLWWVSSHNGDLTVHVATDWPERQRLLLIRGPNLRVTGPLFNNVGSVQQPYPRNQGWRGLSLYSWDAQVALRQDGSVYVDDSRGPLPMSVIGKDGGVLMSEQSARLLMEYQGGFRAALVPTYYSPLMRIYTVQCGALWRIAVLFATPALVRLGRWGWRRLSPLSVRARRRMARGLCVGCGYDLRATPERCPECGRVVV